MGNLIDVQRGGLYDRTGRRLSLHLWLGPLGLHVFRKGPGSVSVQPDHRVRGWFKEVFRGLA